MRKIGILCAWLGIAVHGTAQQDTAKRASGDTVKVGGITIINNDTHGAGSGVSWDSDAHGHYHHHSTGRVQTNWLLVDFGFDNYTDNTNYASAETQALSPGATTERFAVRTGKSTNFNLWFFMQKLSLYKRMLNLKYGFGIETHNYRYTSNIVYKQNPLLITPDTIVYNKDKLATDYFTVPLMINYTFNPYSETTIGISFGMSAGYMYSCRQKLISNEHGKQFTHSSFNLQPWRFDYIGELTFGPVGLYGAFATRSMYKYGLDLTPYTIGVRLTY